MPNMSFSLRFMIGVITLFAVIFAVINRVNLQKNQIRNDLKLTNLEFAILKSDDHRAVLLVYKQRGAYELMVAFRNRKRRNWYMPIGTGSHPTAPYPDSVSYSKQYGVRPTSAEIEQFCCELGLEDI